MATDPNPLSDQVAQALAGDVDPERIEGYRFATGILPVFALIRSLFSQSEFDTCLKLMLLFELSRSPGRASLAQVRSLANYLDPARVDSMVSSLKDGGWLELRAVDNTYVPSLVGVNLLSLLAAADVGNLSPQNALARVAQNAEFGAKLDGARTSISLLLDQLHVLIDDRVEEAKTVLRVGRPARMISWSRGEHAAQVDTIRRVLGTLSERLDAASRWFGALVRLHTAIEALIGVHQSIHERLREWNLDRLHSSDAGYSVAQLAEAVMGSDERSLERAINEGIVQSPPLTLSLSTDEVRARFHGARRRLQGQDKAFVYVEPPVAAVETWTKSDVDPASALRARLSALFAPHVHALELEEWINAPTVGTGAWELALLSRLEATPDGIVLADSRRVDVDVAAPPSTGAPAGALVAAWREQSAVRDIGVGVFGRTILHTRIDK